MIVTNKRYSYPRVAVIRIDVHPTGDKSDQHATCFPRSVCVWPSTIHISRDPRIATFHEVIDRVGQSHCSQEKGIPDYIPSTLADRSTGPHPLSLPLTTIEVAKKATQLSTTCY
jgi:hypothetical protein